MAQVSQNLISNSQPRFAIRLNPSSGQYPIPSPLPSLSRRSLSSISQLSLLIGPISSFSTHHSSFLVRAHDSRASAAAEQTRNFDLDSFLSASELLCISSSAVLSVALAVSSGFSGWTTGFIGVVWRRVLEASVVALAVGILLGAWIRRRQWRRICVESVTGGDKSLNVVERIEKMEEDLKSSATIIRVLSRQLEKLGIRFRVTRRTLKDPIAQAAALAQKTSEATRALAVQADILEKELGEVQKVLLAMQDHQKKQLELILAIGKSEKLLESEQEHDQVQDIPQTSKATDEAKQMEIHEAQASGMSNDRP